MVGALTSRALKVDALAPISPDMKNTITRCGATIITTATILAGAAPAIAQPHPYERGKVTAVKVERIHKRAADVSPKGRAHAKPIRIRWADRGERELHPYGKGSYAGPGRSLRMIPRPGSDGTNALCRSGSKAARWAC
jgi:hypothetical protein